MIHRQIFSRKSFIEEKSRTIFLKAGISAGMKACGQGHNKKKNSLWKRRRRDERRFSPLRSSRLVPGDLLDRTSRGGKKRMEDDGTVVTVDVPHLWHGSMYRTDIQKHQKDSGGISGKSVHDRDLCGRIWHRNAAEAL